MDGDTKMFPHDVDYLRLTQAILDALTGGSVFDQNVRRSDTIGLAAIADAF